MIDGMKNASVPVITIAIPHITKTLAMPIASAINPVASNPKMEGNKLILSNKENTRPKKDTSICVCNKAVTGIKRHGNPLYYCKYSIDNEC